MNISIKNNPMIQIQNLSKSYGNEPVLDRLNMDLQAGRAYCLMAPSGTGKTTLFRILMGLEKPDSGQISGLKDKRITAVFQEDRLLEGYTALENIRFVTGKQYSNAALYEILTKVLPPESLKKPVSEFSGGMKRRTAILRAVLAPSDMIIMDEPFTGLDADTKRTVADLIRTYTGSKLLLIAAHSEEDARLLSAEILHLD